MLSVDIKQIGRCFLHSGHGAGLTVNFADTSAPGNFPADNNLPIFRKNIHGLQMCRCFFIHFKDQLHKSKFGAFPDHFSGSLLSQRQIDRADEYGFTCACLTCKDIQAFRKVHFYLIDQRQIFYM